MHTTMNVHCSIFSLGNTSLLFFNICIWDKIFLCLGLHEWHVFFAKESSIWMTCRSDTLNFSVRKFFFLYAFARGYYKTIIVTCSVAASTEKNYFFGSVENSLLIQTVNKFRLFRDKTFFLSFSFTLTTLQILQEKVLFFNFLARAAEAMMRWFWIWHIGNHWDNFFFMLFILGRLLEKII